MIKLTVLILVSLLSVGCYASSCVISDTSIAEYSKKYRALIQIEATKNNGLYIIVLKVPPRIGEDMLQSVILHKEQSKVGDTSYSIPLESIVEENKAISYFSIDENNAKHSFFTLDFGEECGLSLKYDLLN